MVAVGLAAVAVLTGLINTFRHWQTMAAEVGTQIAVLGVAGPTAIYVALLLAVWYRQNWARIVLLVVLLISVPGYLITLVGAYPTVSKVVQGLQLILNTATFVLLLTPASRHWFKRVDT